MTIYTQKSNRSLFNPVLVITLLSLLCALAPNQVQAKTCRKVHLEVNNRTGKNIKILDLDYWDTESEKWRSEPVRNEMIRNNRVWQETRNLEHVHNQNVKIRVEYRVAKWNKFLKRTTWSKKQRYLANPKKCTKGADFTMTIR
jgi:hypothetical protein